MELTRIAQLLEPFLDVAPEERLLQNISTYIDMLLRWNARINLTAVRGPDEIATRHFGESLFTARHLFPLPGLAAGAASGPGTSALNGTTGGTAAPGYPLVLDVGSGAGFPGIPLKLWAPHIRLTLVESNHKKATFLREVIRTLSLADAEVFSGRAEAFPTATADVVTLRAVEQFDAVLPAASQLVVPGGRLALLIGQAQAARVAVASFEWFPPRAIPLSTARVLLLGTRHGEPRR